MLTYQQILHFRTFGYVTLRGLLSAAEAAMLRQEVTAALAGAFGRIATERGLRPGPPAGLAGLGGRRRPGSLTRDRAEAA